MCSGVFVVEHVESRQATSEISSSPRVITGAIFSVGVSTFGPTAAPDVPPVSDNAPATPNTVTAFVLFLRFETCSACDMVEASHSAPPTHPLRGCPILKERRSKGG